MSQNVPYLAAARLPTLLVQKSRANKRQLILTEAAQLFRERGFSGASMRDLGERAGMDAASMYNYIRSKDEILESICFQVAHQYLAQLTEAQAIEATYLEKIKVLIALHVRLMTQNGAAVSVANTDWKSLTGAKLIEFKAARKRYEKGLAALIEQGIAAGELQPVNVSVAMFTILSAVRWVELWHRPSCSLSAAKLEANIITVLLNGLEKK